MVKFKVQEGVELPKYESNLAAGFDVTAQSIVKAFKGDTEVTGDKLEKIKQGFVERGYIKIRPFERIMFDTGLTVADMSENIELQVRSRSGVSLKRGLFVANQPGTIDPDYRGVVGVIIYNSTPFLNKVEKGERIAQIVASEFVRVDISSIDEISTTNRGSDGFGSTGK